jgi:hypothetical protein
MPIHDIVSHSTNKDTRVCYFTLCVFCLEMPNALFLQFIVKLQHRKNRVHARSARNNNYYTNSKTCNVTIKRDPALGLQSVVIQF